MKYKNLAFALAVAPVAAFSQVTAIGPFTGTLQEGWESHGGGFLPTLPIFGGAGDAVQLGAGQGLHVTTGWSFFNVVSPHGGARFMGGAGVNYSIVFDMPAFQFGAYFATNTDVPGATATFFDANNVQIGGSMPVGAPLVQWQWNGWEVAQGVSRIDIVASNSWGGFIMIDDLEYNAFVPEPGAFVALAAGLGLLLVRRKR